MRLVFVMYVHVWNICLCVFVCRMCESTYAYDWNVCICSLMHRECVYMCVRVYDGCIYYAQSIVCGIYLYVHVWIVDMDYGYIHVHIWTMDMFIYGLCVYVSSCVEYVYMYIHRLKSVYIHVHE